MDIISKVKDLQISRKIYIIIGISFFSLFAVALMSQYLIRTNNIVAWLGMAEHKYASENYRARINFEKYVETEDPAIKSEFDVNIDVSIGYAKLFSEFDDHLKTMSNKDLAEVVLTTYEEFNTIKNARGLVDRLDLMLFIEMEIARKLIRLAEDAYPLGLNIKSLVGKYRSLTDDKKPVVYREIVLKFNEIQELGLRFSVLIRDLTELIQSAAFISLFLFALLCGVGCLLVSVLISRSITRPLPQLLELTEKMLSDQEELARFSKGQYELDEKLRGQQLIEDLSQDVVTFLAKHLGAHAGAFYVNDGNNVFALTAGYAFKTKKNLSNEYRLGEGLVGQAAQEKQTILFTNVPDDYIIISSGLGEKKPNVILVIPFVYNDMVTGVVELGTFGSFTEQQMTFLENASKSIAITLNSVLSRKQLDEALQKSRQLTNELQVQQKTLPSADEELEEQTRGLAFSGFRLSAPLRPE